MRRKGISIAGRSPRAELPDRTDWKRLATLSDREIESAIAADPDAAPLLDQAWFASAHIVDPTEKERITIRLDKGILDFFRKFGPRYQTRINSVLRAFVVQAEVKAQTSNRRVKRKITRAA
jgi:uncharacterized protein (DUF4415 family)